MGNYLYNGVALPDIRSVYTPELQAKYPKVFCRVTDRQPILYMFADPSVKYSSFVHWVGTFSDNPGDYAFSKCVDGQWGAVTEVADTVFNAWVDDDMWCNFDIVYDGKVLVAASDPIPVPDPEFSMSTGNGFTLYNGIEVSTVSKWNKKLYPHAVLIANYDKNNVALHQAHLMCVDKPFYYDSTTGKCKTDSPFYQWYALGSQNDAWHDMGLNLTSPEVSMGLKGNVYQRMWTNTDIDGYLAATDPVEISSATDKSVSVTFDCSNLESTESIYQIYAWIYPKGGGQADAVATWQSEPFAGTDHSERHTFTGLTHSTEYEVYALLVANNAATEYYATATFTTTGIQVKTGMYIGVNGIARNIKKVYIGDKNGVAQEIFKIYVGVGGIARRRYGSGIKWNKYSCNVASKNEYQKTNTNVGTVTSVWYNSATSLSLYTSYLFSAQNGYQGAGGAFTIYIADCNGYYIVNSLGVDHISACNWERNGDQDGYRLSLTHMASAARVTIYSYSKGTTSYGIVTTDEGDIPDNGTIVEGSVDGNYCVVKIGSSYYYYEKV